MRRGAALLLGLSLLAVLVVGCGGGSSSGSTDASGSSGGGSLIVLGASSLTEAVTRYGEGFGGATVKPSFAGSDELAAQIQQGAPADVFASANTRYPEELFEEGLVEKPQVFCRNELVIAVPEGSDIKSIADLTKPGTKIVIGDESVPVGGYTREVLGRLPKAEEQAILGNVVSEETEVASIVAKLEQGAADAGFVYVTDETGAEGLEPVEIDSKLQPRVEYGVAVIKSSKDKPAAEEFVEGLVDGEGQEDLLEAGFPAPAVRRSWFAGVALVAALATVVFLLVPIVAVFANVSPARLVDALGEEASREALLLSLRTTLIALAIVVLVGTPTAYLAARDFPGRSVVLTIIELPLVMPPAVAGIALLAAFGPKGILGGWVSDAGIELVFQTAGVVVALVFVSAPFFLRQAVAAFAAVDGRLLEAARTLGAGPFRAFLTVAVPSARGGLASGVALSWGRALGEFGATLLFAGSLQGVTRTAPLAIFSDFAEPGGFVAALALSAVLILVSAALLLGVKLLGGDRVEVDEGMARL